MSYFSWPPEWSGTERMQLGHQKINQPVLQRQKLCISSELHSLLSAFLGCGHWDYLAAVCHSNKFGNNSVSSTRKPRLLTIAWGFCNPLVLQIIMTLWCHPDCRVPERRSAQWLWRGKRHQPLSVPPPFCCHLIVWGIGRTINKRD